MRKDLIIFKPFSFLIPYFYFLFLIFLAPVHPLNLQHNTFHLHVITFCVIRLFKVTSEEESDGFQSVQ